MKTPSRQAPSPADMTRAALIRAALKLFGQKGFDGTSTREIAAAAHANIGSIAYHFGGKEGLRIACADFIVDTIRTITGQALEVGALEAGAIEGGALKVGEAHGETAATAQLAAAMDRMVGFLIAQPEAGEIVQFVLRELSHPTAALDAIYEGVFEPTHKRLCIIWGAATGEDPESDQAKLAVFTMIGQVVYFRIAREAVMRRMGWPKIGPEEASAVAAVTKENLSAILAARKARP
jgi:AcrR family transcriptional regulator